MSKDSKLLLAAVTVSTALLVGLQLYLHVRVYNLNMRVAQVLVKASPTPAATVEASPSAEPTASASATPRVRATARPTATASAEVEE